MRGLERRAGCRYRLKTWRPEPIGRQEGGGCDQYRQAEEQLTAGEDQRDPDDDSQAQDQRPRLAVPDENRKGQLVIDDGVGPEVDEVLTVLAPVLEECHIERPRL